MKQQKTRQMKKSRYENKKKTRFKILRAKKMTVYVHDHNSIEPFHS